jgi:2-dehydro-3-deoxy-D-arabinonate dehydratase
VPVAEAPPAEEMEIQLVIARERAVVFEGSTQVALLKRGLSELVAWLFRSQTFPVGAVLLTGTSVIPAREFTLRSGDEVRIAITGLGELVNTVEVV